MVMLKLELFSKSLGAGVGGIYCAIPVNAKLETVWVIQLLDELRLDLLIPEHPSRVERHLYLKST